MSQQLEPAKRPRKCLPSRRLACTGQESAGHTRCGGAHQAGRAHVDAYVVRRVCARSAERQPVHGALGRRRRLVAGVAVVSHRGAHQHDGAAAAAHHRLHLRARQQLLSSWLDCLHGITTQQRYAAMCWKLTLYAEVNGKSARTSSQPHRLQVGHRLLAASRHASSARHSEA